MATAELIKIKTASQKEHSDLSCEKPGAVGSANLELKPVKKIRYRECSDLRHWWDAEDSTEDSFECA